MDFSFKCQRCGSRNHTDVESIGTTIRCSYCSVDLEVPLTAFSSGIVQGDYWFHHKVGTGSVSEVYVTKLMSTVHEDEENESTGKLYIKVMSPLATVDERATRRFFESILQSQLVDHPNVVSVTETGIMKNHYYAATPYIDGECVDAIIERDGPLAEIDALRICLRVAKLMRDVWNQHRLVHQALKPANILLNDEGEVFILDLCNSKQCLVPVNGRIESINPHGNLFDYMNPEQIQNLPDLNPTSDIYSLGATLHCMIAGEKPYTDTMTSSIVQKHLWSPPPQLESYVQDVSPQTADLVRWMMGGSESGEYHSWEELIKRIQEIYRPKRKVDGAATGTHPKVKPMHFSKKHRAPAPPETKPDTQPIRVFRKRKRSVVSTDSQHIELVPQKKSNGNGLLIAMLMLGTFFLGALTAGAIWLINKNNADAPSANHQNHIKPATPRVAITTPKTPNTTPKTPSTAPKTHTVPASPSSYNKNLIINGGAEEDPLLTGWEKEMGIWTGGGGRRNHPNRGKRFFRKPDKGHGKLYQDINVAAYKDAISKGTQEFQFTGYIKDDYAFKCVIECCNSSGKKFSTTEVTSSPSGKWEETKKTISAPPETTIIRVNLIADPKKKMRGGFDDLSLVALPPNT